MSFINEDFLLYGETAKKLYHDYAEKEPIIDYHCHIPPAEIAADKHFSDITELWLGADHYKWRMIRSCGVPENEITGNADPKTKFIRFAESLPRAIGNPMYHWTHLELKRYFGYDGILCPETADEVYDLCNEKLRSDDFSACSLIARSNVKMIGTTDDPADDLRYHKEIKDSALLGGTLVLPSFRPDRSVKIRKPDFCEYIAALGESANVEITDFESLLSALISRLDFFASLGCRASDHGLDKMVYMPIGKDGADRVLKKALRGEAVTEAEADGYATELLIALGAEYKKRGIVMQLHYSVQRDPNSARYAALGADSGFDCIATYDSATALTGLLNALEKEGALPKTIIYSLDPAANEMIGTVIGSFQSDEIPCKVQLGAAWWFNDTKRGMENQLQAFAELSVLGNFVGMLTDSRSFLSYTRHEYFRRILCSLIGKWVDRGEYPSDLPYLGSLISDICYGNAKRYFDIKD